MPLDELELDDELLELDVELLEEELELEFDDVELLEEELELEEEELELLEDELELPGFGFESSLPQPDINKIVQIAVAKKFSLSLNILSVHLTRMSFANWFSCFVIFLF